MPESWVSRVTEGMVGNEYDLNMYKILIEEKQRDRLDR